MTSERCKCTDNGHPSHRAGEMCGSQAVGQFDWAFYAEKVNRCADCGQREMADGSLKRASTVA